MALADETAIELKDGPGRDVVETNCGICHSLDYIQLNSPFPDEELWQAEVAKPAEPAEAADDAAKPQPDKHEIGGALERALGYAGKAADFDDKADKIATHDQSAVAWLGDNWHKLLPLVGLVV